MASSQYDETLIQILQAEGKIMPFLDVIFGFLHRCIWSVATKVTLWVMRFSTDFYHEHTSPSALGFPAGVAEQLLITTFRKWQNEHRRAAAAPPAAAEEVVVTSPTPDRTSQSCGLTGATPPPAVATSSPAKTAPARTGEGRCSTRENSASDSYNGATREKYSWSQTITDLTVRVPVSPDIRRGRQVSVEILSDGLSVRLAGGDVLVEGQLHRTIQAAESTWSLLPGDSVQLSLEKVQECWWSSLLKTEPSIDLRQIEAAKPWEDLSQEEQMKIGQLRVQQEAKLTGASRGAQSAPVVTSTGSKDVSALLKEAWDAEGSPFRGQPYDPSIVELIPRVDGSN